MEGSAVQPGQPGHPPARQPEAGHLAPRRQDPALLRISDADRNRVAEVLRVAAGDGRINLAELDERLDATFAAKTYADLVPITVDLPIPGGQLPHADITPHRRAGLPATKSHVSSWAVMSEQKRQGAWLVQEHHSAFALMGTVVLDLRQATFAAKTVTITANAIMGEVRVLVDAHTHVEVDGVPIMGDFNQRKDQVTAQLTADSPTVHVRGMALMGSVKVLRQPPPGTPRKFLGTY